MELHHDKHHAAYVKGANEAHEKLAEARTRSDFSTINQLERDLAFHTSGHVLHSLFWTNLGPHGGDQPSGALAGAIERDFGSFDAFKAQLTDVTNKVQGSGWGALAYDGASGRLVVQQIYDHQSNLVVGSTPLLVIDAWEHAYYLQYRNARPDFVKAIWNIVNWTDVMERYTEVAERFARARA
jgi:Fe-Mn family superoxide dismutase